MKGTYLLILHLNTALHKLPVGKLGSFDFPAGYYLYVGSAFGPGGLNARLAHHGRRAKPRPHWHIDYLRARSDLLEAWGVRCAEHFEHAWACALCGRPEVRVAIPGFGASDSPCVSHLFFSAIRPSSRALTETLLAGCDTAGISQHYLSIEIHTFNDYD